MLACHDDEQPNNLERDDPDGERPQVRTGDARSEAIHARLPIGLATRAGTPTTVTASGTSAMTAAPAPTITLTPMLIAGRTTAPTPMRVAWPTQTPPQSTARGATCANS